MIVKNQWQNKRKKQWKIPPRRLVYNWEKIRKF